MKKVDSYGGYDFYICTGTGDRPTLYNIVPTGSKPPHGGYPDRRYIEKVKNTKFLTRYQPTLHGCCETYSGKNNDYIQEKR